MDRINIRRVSPFLLAGIVLAVSSVALIQYSFAQSAICCAPGKLLPTDPVHGTADLKVPGIAKNVSPGDPIHGASQISPGFLKSCPPNPPIDQPGPCS